MKNLYDELRDISIKNEVWMPFKRYGNIYYSISNKGRFSSGVSINPKRHNGRGWKINIISSYNNQKGYKIVRTRENGKTKYYQLHRIVLTVFKPCTNMEKLQVNHIDGNKSNNILDNLEWCTCKENIEHSIKTGLSDLTKIPCGIRLSNTQVERVPGSYSAPTIQMAMKWLRKVHNLCIAPYAAAFRYGFTIDKADTGSNIGNEKTLSIPDYSEITTWEEACEAAIKYCLEHLI